MTGVPVRAAFFARPRGAPAARRAAPAGARRQPGREADQRGDAGGGGAAHRAGFPALRIVHQAGARNLEEARAAYAQAGVGAPHVEVVPFLDDVAGAMAASHLLVSRAGAITLAEICAAGRASLLVPLAIAQGHQVDNARLLAEAGAAEMIPSDQLSAERLAARLEELLGRRRPPRRHGAGGARPGPPARRRRHRRPRRRSWARSGRSALMFNRFTDLSRIHFVGIGGAGMSGIAEILLEYDLEVSGCDQSLGEATARLTDMGAQIEQGHSPDHLEGVELLVISSAVADDNPEVREARRRGITVVRRAEMLGELMRLKYGIAVAGTHGKTTTTSLVGTLLTDAGLDPTVIVGGRLRLLGTGARLGKSDYLVAEADEFDRSFLRLTPVIAVITNIDRDHLDTYGTLEAIQDAFVEFGNRVPFFGRLIVCLDDANVQKILPRMADRRILTYGLSPQADLSAVERRAARRRQPLRRAPAQRPPARPRRPRHHRAADPRPPQRAQRPGGGGRGARAAASISTPSPAPSPASRGCTAASSTLGTWRGAAVVDDYAHHPTEVDATLAGGAPDLPRGPGVRRLPAAPLLAHPGPGRGVRPRPAGSRHGAWSPTSTPRASSRSPASPASWWSTRRGTAATATSTTARPGRTRRSCCATRSAPRTS